MAALEHQRLVPDAAAGRRGMRIAALMAASAAVLVVGSGLGVLLAGWHLELPSLPRRAAPSEAAPPPSTSTPPPITETMKLQPPPRPPASIDETRAPTRALPLPPPSSDEPQATRAVPLPPPPKPSPWSAAAGGETSTTDAIDDAIDALLLEAKGSGGSSDAADAAGTAGATPQVFVHYTAIDRGSSATALNLVRRLKAAGFTVAAREVQIPIAAPSVRYFFAADRDEAEAVVASLEGQMPGGATPPVLDFTDFEPKPRPGEVEVWIN